MKNGRKHKTAEKACQSNILEATHEMKTGNYSPRGIREDEAWESCSARPHFLSHALGEPAELPTEVKEVLAMCVPLGAIVA